MGGIIALPKIILITGNGEALVVRNYPISKTLIIILHFFSKMGALLSSLSGRTSLIKKMARAADSMERRRKHSKPVITRRYMPSDLLVGHPGHKLIKETKRLIDVRRHAAEGSWLTFRACLVRCPARLPVIPNNFSSLGNDHLSSHGASSFSQV